MSGESAEPFATNSAIDQKQGRRWVAMLIWGVVCACAVTTSSLACFFAYQASHEGTHKISSFEEGRDMFHSLAVNRIQHPRRSLRRSMGATSEWGTGDERASAVLVEETTCTDDDVACASWSHRGFCKHDRLAAFVQASCALSCSLCQGHKAAVPQAVPEPASKALRKNAKSIMGAAHPTNSDLNGLPLKGEGDAQASNTFSIYRAQVKVGTPPQMLNVAVDTGSPNLWLPDKKCQLSMSLAGPWQPCKKNRFDSTRSTSSVQLDEFNKVWPVAYAGGGLLAARSVDSISLASVRQFTAALYRGEKLVGPDFKYGHFDGVLGLSREERTVSYGEPKEDKKKANFNTLRAARDNGALSRALVAFLLLPPSANKRGVDGLVTLGGFSKSHYKGSITWHEVLQTPNPLRRGQWLIRVKNLQAGDDPTNLCGTDGCEALLDSGTSTVRVPHAAGVAKSLGIAPDCSHLKSKAQVMLGIGAKKYPLSARQVTYIMKHPLVGQVCKSNLDHTDASAGSRTGIVLGAPFFESYFVVLDNEDTANPRVGIAIADHSSVPLSD